MLQLVQGENEFNIHHRGTETQRKTRSKSKPEVTEVAEITEAQGSGCLRGIILVFGESPRRAEIRRDSSTE
jgi:hypothetical protein